MKIPRSTFLEAKGGSKKVVFPLFLRGRGPSKKHACFLEGAAWNFSWLTPFGPRPSNDFSRNEFRHYITFSLPQIFFGWNNFALHCIVLTATLKLHLFLFTLHYIKISGSKLILRYITLWNVIISGRPVKPRGGRNFIHPRFYTPPTP